MDTEQSLNTFVPLTPRRQAVLGAIEALTIDNHPPSMEEIGRRLGITKGTVCEHIKKLVDGGYVSHRRHGTRNLRVVTSPGRRRQAAWAAANRAMDEALVDCGEELAAHAGAARKLAIRSVAAAMDALV